MYDIIENVYNPSQTNIKNWRENIIWDFSGGPVVKTPCFHCRGLRFISGWETKIHMLWGMAKIYFLKKKICIGVFSIFIDIPHNKTFQ